MLGECLNARGNDTQNTQRGNGRKLSANKVERKHLNSGFQSIGCTSTTSDRLHQGTRNGLTNLSQNTRHLFSNFS